MNEKIKILNLFKAGEITADEALIRLENAVKSFQFICIQLEGEDRVSLKIPFKLLKSGIKLANLMPKSVQQKIQGHLDKSGIDFDLSQMTKERLDELIH